MNSSILLPALLLAATTVTASPAAPDRIVLPDDMVPVHYSVSIVPDATALSFLGSVTIDLDVRKPTRTIVLNAADLSFTRVSLKGVAKAPAVSFDKEQETATFTFASPLSKGPHVLSIDYRGRINQHPAGLFALDYGTAGGSRRALFTQFENSDARRFMPCWDEPGIKASFTLTATVAADLMPLSNMPIAKTEKSTGGLVKVSFAETPKMSSYLLFFGVGDFERISRKVNGVDLGVIVKRGDTGKGAYALDAAAHILPYYEDYFGLKYPLPKLDLIAGPGESQTFGAMENWGAIFYFEYDLLIDPRISTQNDERRVYTVVAHEMAHQWFGDLVTMAWWDDLWLNEGYASWMEIKAPDHFHPEWELWLDSQAAKEAAMRVDARMGTHPIVTPIRDVLQADQAFDTITYEKGESVIRMLEQYVGPDAFRDGVRAYMKDHAYGNTVTDDLWSELDKGSKLPVTQVAHDFTLQAGIPLIRATTTAGGMHLAQDRFAVDDSGKAGGSWHVPVTVATIGGTVLWQGLVSADKPVDVPVPANSVAVVNAGQASYFRTLYDAAGLQKVAADFQVLKPADQLGLLNDSLALGNAGYAPLSDFLTLTSHVTPDLDPTVLSTVIARLVRLNFLYEGLPGQAAFQAYARGLLDPVLAKLGWTAQAGESQNTALLRSDLLTALGEFNDPAVVAEAQKRFAVYLKDPASLTAELRHVVLHTVAAHADAATWEQLHGLARTATSSLEKNELYRLLGAAHDRELATKALALALTDEAPVTVRPTIVDATAYYHPDMAVDFVTSHSDVFDTLIEPTGRVTFLPRLASFSRDLGMIPKLEAYADKHIPADARGNVVKAEGAIRENTGIRTARLPDVDAWLKAHPSN
ncbi:MAG TPA: M1 family metallopeptidase [Gammaproteobacteria bacterium]|nr:M1 family metallopeptidase [Gammaproteobacteria bacterium]